MKNSKEKIKKRKSTKAFIIALINIVVIAGAIIGAYFVFYTPEKRFERSIEEAQKAFDNKDYQEACTQYRKAMELDEDSLVARLGLLRVYEALGDTDNLSICFTEGIDYIRSLDEETFAANKSLILNIYLYAGKVYEGDGNREQRVAIYEEAYEKDSQNRLVKEALVKDYSDIAAEKYKAGELDEEIAYYNKVLALDSENEVARLNSKNHVTDKIRECIDAELFDEADAVIEMFKDCVAGVEFDTLSEENSKKRRIHDAKYDLLSAVYENMSEKNYEAMLSLDGSVDANFVSVNNEGSIVYTPKDGVVENYTGTAAAMIMFKGEAYYFYYGEFIDGICNGNGVMFLMTNKDNNAYYLYDGVWANNKPNGNGKVTSVNEYDEATKALLTREEVGNFTDGLQDGEIKGSIVINNKETFLGKWNVKNGVPKDVASQYSDYPFEVPKGKVLYAVLLNSDGSVGWGSWISKNGHLGVIPFVN